MECGSTKFLVGLGIGSAIGALVYHFSRTAKAKKLKNDVFNALREIEPRIFLLLWYWRSAPSPVLVYLSPNVCTQTGCSAYFS